MSTLSLRHLSDDCDGLAATVRVAIVDQSRVQVWRTEVTWNEKGKNAASVPTCASRSIVASNSNTSATAQLQAAPSLKSRALLVGGVLTDGMGSTAQR